MRNELIFVPRVVLDLLVLPLQHEILLTFAQLLLRHLDLLLIDLLIQNLYELFTFMPRLLNLINSTIFDFLYLQNEGVLFLS